jgi:hypothetical protein
MAVTLWKAEYHHLAFLDDVMGSQSSMACSFSVFMAVDVGAIAATKYMQDFGTADEMDPRCRVLIISRPKLLRVKRSLLGSLSLLAFRRRYKLVRNRIFYRMRFSHRFPMHVKHHKHVLMYYTLKPRGLPGCQVNHARILRALNCREISL